MEGGGRSNTSYCLESTNYPRHLSAGLIDLLEDKDCPLTDVTLGCEGQFIQAHRVVLALSSPFFKEFFRINRIDSKTCGNCLIVLANVKFVDLKNIVQFMYHGKITIGSGELGAFLEAGKVLQIQGLSEMSVPTDFGHSARLDDKSSKSERAQNIPDVHDAHPLAVVTGSFTLSSSSTMASQVKRPRLTENAGAELVSGFCTPATAPPVGSSQTPAAVETLRQPSSSAGAPDHCQNRMSSSRTIDIDPLGDERTMNEDSSSEEMINLDAVKSERIEVFSSFQPNENTMSFSNMQEIVTVVPGTPGISVLGRVDYSSYPMQAGSAQQQNAGPSSALGGPQARTNTGSSPVKTTNSAGEDRMTPQALLDSLLSPPRNQKPITIRCKVCNIMMTQEQYNAPTHVCPVRSAHTGVVDPIPCPICGNIMKNRNSLKAHKSIYHRKVREGGSPISSGVRLTHLVDVYPFPDEPSAFSPENPISGLQQQATTASPPKLSPV